MSSLDPLRPGVSDRYESWIVSNDNDDRPALQCTNCDGSFHGAPQDTDDLHGAATVDSSSGCSV